MSTVHICERVSDTNAEAKQHYAACCDCHLVMAWWHERIRQRRWLRQLELPHV